jgi:hypothetical protein
VIRDGCKSLANKNNSKSNHNGIREQQVLHFYSFEKLQDGTPKKVWIRNNRIAAKLANS